MCWPCSPPRPEESKRNRLTKPPQGIMIPRHRGGAGSLAGWFTNGLRGTDRSSVGGGGSQIRPRTSLLTNFRHCLRRFGGRDIEASSGSSNASSIVVVFDERVQDNQPTQYSIAAEPSNINSPRADPSKYVTRINNAVKGPPANLMPARSVPVPYEFEFAPYPGHTCITPKPSPAAKAIISLESHTETPANFKYNTSFKNTLKEYNKRNAAFGGEPVCLRHITKVTSNNWIEVKKSPPTDDRVQATKKTGYAVRLLKSHPSCGECKERGKCHVFMGRRRPRTW